MITIPGPFISESIQNLKEAFEVVFLFASHNINRKIQVMFFDFYDGCGNILGNVEAGVIRT